MSRRRAQVVLLTEDKQQQVFARRLLQGLGFDASKLRILPLPAGRGSGTQYVLEQYAPQVKELRRRSGQVQLALVVVLDADNRDVADRLRQLADELQAARSSPRAPEERIILLVPRRNIETWLAYLLGQLVNETDTYPRLQRRERDCQPAVDRMLELYRSNQPLPADCPPSLVVGLDELRRLK